MDDGLELRTAPENLTHPDLSLGVGRVAAVGPPVVGDLAAADKTEPPADAPQLLPE